jgi:hypothetical protein
MTDRDRYAPGPASGARIRWDGEKWTLILVRELRHSPEKAEGGGSLRSTVKLTTMKLTTMKLTMPPASATHALLDRLVDHLHGRASASVRSLHA